MNDKDLAEKMLDEQRKNRKETLEILVYACIGLCITVGSFLLFHFFGNLWLVTLLICLFDVAYAYFHACIFFRSKDWHGAKKILIPWIMMLYWLIVFVAVCIFNSAILHYDFSYKLLLYPIFLMPSFVLVMLSAALLNYA